VEIYLKSLFRILFFFMLILSSSCVTKSGYIETRGMIDNSIYYYEIDRIGEKYPISSEDIQDKKPQRVPYGALVDLDSIIYIKVIKENLYIKNEVSLSDFEKKKNNIMQALGFINGIIELRSEVVELYRKGQESEFNQKKEELAKKESKFLDLLKGIWPEETEEYKKLSDSYDPPKFRKLIKFFQEQIDKLDESLKVFIAIKAFLEKSSKGNIPIHLDHYDTGDEGVWREHDRWAYNLSSVDIEEFKEIDEILAKTNDSIYNLKEEISKCFNNDVCINNSIDGQFTPIKIEEDIKDTFIDLKHLPRSTGDIIRVKATLYKGEKARDTSVAKFRLEKLGWYSEISPALVLAKPDQLKSEDNGFRFIPVVAWMHHWVPRPEDPKWINNFFLRSNRV